jgi:hypothetical protein
VVFSLSSRDETIPLKFFVDFWDYFGLFSIQIRGAISTFVYCPPNLNRKWAKIIPEIDEKFYWDRFLYIFAPLLPAGIPSGVILIPRKACSSRSWELKLRLKVFLSRMRGTKMYKVEF